MSEENSNLEEPNDEESVSDNIDWLYILISISVATLTVATILILINFVLF